MKELIWKRRWSVIIFLLLAVFFTDSLFSYAKPREITDYIRVGLTKDFYDKPSLTIETKGVKIGICKEDNFFPLETLYSETGIRITKKKGEFYVLPTAFSSLTEAQKEAHFLSKHNKGTFFPVLVSYKRKKGNWKLYVENGEENLLSAEKRAEPSEGLLIYQTEQESFGADAFSLGGYPQLEAGNRVRERLIRLEGKQYRGRLEIGSYGKNGVTAVNVIRMEDYLRGVLPIEIGYTWHLSAMKAQAVCARSFALATAGFRADSEIKKGYRLNNRTHQSYGGYEVEGEKTDRAVFATAGEVLTYKNKVIRPYYFSTSGGATEDMERVFEKRKPYLRSVPDLYETKPAKKAWTLAFTKEEVAALVSASASKKGICLGEIKELSTGSYSASERAGILSIVGSEGELVLKNEEIRRVFDLPGTKFRVFYEGEGADEVTVLFKRNEGLKKRKRGLKGATVLSKNGTHILSEEGRAGEQVMVLSGNNRKGFYIGKKKTDTFLFVGSGYGHGVGLSQSGAEGMARAGFGYKRILEHYFKGAVVQ